MSDDNKKGQNTSEAIILNSEKLSPSLNDILSSENSKEKEIFPKINRKIPENQPLSMNILKKKIKRKSITFISNSNTSKYRK
jgi:hypothetical protein